MRPVKRFLSALLAALMLCAPALAEEVIGLPDAVVTFQPMEGMLCLTRETSASVFNRVGLSQREIVSWMEQSDAYAMMFDLATGSEVGLYLFTAEDDLLEDMTDAEREYLCQDMAEYYEQNGYEGVTTCIHEGAGGLWLQVTGLTWSTAGMPCHIVTLMSVRRGYHVQASLFMDGEDRSEMYLDRFLAMADSLRIELAEGLTEMTAGDVTVRLRLPEGMVCHTSAEAAGIAPAPEALTGEIAGVLTPQDGAWYVQWQVLEGASGDMERLSETGLRALYEDRARKKKAAGFTVTGKESVTEMRQVFTHLTYELPEGWHAEEYYTKQSGWGVTITAYSAGQPLPEAAHALLRELLEAQMIIVTGK